MKKITKWATAGVAAAALAGGALFAPAMLAPEPEVSPVAIAPHLRDFPGPDNTGVPEGTVLTPYTGSCTINPTDTPLNLDGKIVNCDRFFIQGTGHRITRSIINGRVVVEEDNPLGERSIIITDSEIHRGDYELQGLSSGNFTAIRVEVTGGNSGIMCMRNCSVIDSWIHGQMDDPSGQAHESGIRVGQRAIIRGNTITCDATPYPPDAGCSANLTMYGDLGIPEYNLIEGNFITGSDHAGTMGYCAYGGAAHWDEYGQYSNHITFKDNVFGRGVSGICGIWGPISSFDSDAPGNVWENNVYEDGVPIPPSM